LDHVVELTQDKGLGIVMEDVEAQNLISKGADERMSSRFGLEVSSRSDRDARID
jgi:hypothetical protein